jgi:eukaryotic-like serine/threonine-protein kinase
VRFTLALAIGALVSVAVHTSSAQVAPRAAEAPAMFRGGPAHLGVYDVAGPRNAAALAWRFKTRGKVRSSPALSGHTLYFGSEDGFLYALDAATGALEWRLSTGAEISSSPAVVDGLVYVASGDDRLYAVAASTGRVRWTFHTGRPLGYALFGSDPRTHDYWASSPAVVGDTVFFGSADGHVYGLDRRAGRLRWKVKTDGMVRSSPAVVDGVVFAGSLDGRLYAIDAETGRTKWTFKTQGNAFFPPGEIQSSPAVADGLVYVGARDGLLYAVDATTGEQRWFSDHTTAWVTASPAVSGGRVIVGDSDGHSVVSVDARTGAEKWRFRTNGRVFSSAAVARGLVYVGNSFGFVYVLDEATGAMKGENAVEAGVHTSPVVADGVVYIGSDDSCVYALREQPAGPHRPVTVAREILERCAGRYAFSPQLSFIVRAADNRLTLEMPGAPPLEMIPESETEFYYEKADMQIRFVPDRDGRIAEMILTQSGISGPLKRIQ